MLPPRRRDSFVHSEALLRAATGPAAVPRTPEPAADPRTRAATAQEARPAPVSAPASAVAPAPAVTSAPAVAPVTAPAPSAAAQAPTSRRAARAAGAATARASSPRTPGRASVASVTTASGAPHPVASFPTRVLGAVKKSALVVAAVGLAASTVLPLLGGAGESAQADGAESPYVAPTGQRLSVDAGVSGSDASRDPYGATSLVDLATQDRRNVAAAVASEYTGPTTADHLAAPLYDELDRDQVLAVAMQYLGTPYVHGGEDPSAFDCSGLITFVYAQFGIELTHYVPAQEHEGRRIPASEAVPGDLVVFDDLAHDGIYAGDGMILDAPKPGGFVDVRPIWTPAHHFVRIDG